MTKSFDNQLSNKDSKIVSTCRNNNRLFLG